MHFRNLGGYTNCHNNFHMFIAPRRAAPRHRIASHRQRHRIAWCDSRHSPKCTTQYEVHFRNLGGYTNIAIASHGTIPDIHQSAPPNTKCTFAIWGVTQISIAISTYSSRRAAPHRAIASHRIAIAWCDSRHSPKCTTQYEVHFRKLGGYTNFHSNFNIFTKVHMRFVLRGCYMN